MVGTLDIEQAIQKGERHFEAGVLASANRGLLYIDEVNLLDDPVVGVLLDFAAMGVNSVEREGISFAHPARFRRTNGENDYSLDCIPPYCLDCEFKLFPDGKASLEFERQVLCAQTLKYKRRVSALKPLTTTGTLLTFIAILPYLA